MVCLMDGLHEDLAVKTSATSKAGAASTGSANANASGGGGGGAGGGAGAAAAGVGVGASGGAGASGGLTGSSTSLIKDMFFLKTVQTVSWCSSHACGSGIDPSHTLFPTSPPHRLNASTVATSVSFQVLQVAKCCPQCHLHHPHHGAQGG